MNLVHKYSRMILMKKASQISRRIRLCPFNQLRKVGILWNEEDSRAYNYLYEQFRTRSVIVRNLCYSDSKHSSDSNIITRKDINWLGFPRGGMTETFISFEFDLLINISTISCYPLDVITALSSASFKIGWDKDHHGFFDMSVDASKQPDSFYLAEQLILYIKKFSK